MSRRDRYKNLSPKEYLDMIRPYLADLIDCHKSTTELNNNDKRGDWKIQLVIQNKCISTKDIIISTISTKILVMYIQQVNL